MDAYVIIGVLGYLLLVALALIFIRSCDFKVPDMGPVGVCPLCHKRIYVPFSCHYDEEHRQ
jgi:hypothetical protein